MRCVLCQTDHAANEPCPLVRPGGVQTTGTQVVAPGVSPLAAAVALRVATPLVVELEPEPAPVVSAPSPAPLQLKNEARVAAPATGPPRDSPAEEDPLVGSSIGSFHVVRKLGVGGMGTVYLGEQAFIGSKVAIKVLHRHLASNTSLVQRFYAEARAANVIGHEHIVNIIDLNLLPPDRYYFIMEYLEGRALSELERPVGHGLLVHVLSQVCDALQAAHEHGVVHRDLKPENIILIKRGRNEHFVKVLDFGIAKLFSTELAGQRTAAGMIMGTPEFMAPEQTVAEAVDGRTDVYSLGVIAYELATGQLPFKGSNLADLLIAHRQTMPVPPHEVHPQVPRAISQAILKALAKAPAERWQTADAFREALEATVLGVAPVGYAQGGSGTQPAFVPVTPMGGVPVAAPIPAAAPPEPPVVAAGSGVRAPPGAPGYVPPPAPQRYASAGSSPSARTTIHPQPVSATVVGTRSTVFTPGPSTAVARAVPRAPTPVSTSSPGMKAPTPAPVQTPRAGSTPALGHPASAGSGVRASEAGASASSWEVKVLDGASPRTLRGTELTRGGMFLHTDQALPAMFSRLKLGLVLADGEFPLKAEVVRHVTPEQSRGWNMPVGFGVQFIELTPSQRDDLANLLKGLPRWQSAVQRAEEKDDPEAERSLAPFKKRPLGTWYELLGLPEDTDFVEVRQRVREAKKAFGEAAGRPLSAKQRELLEQLEKRYDEAMAVLGHPRNRLDYDGGRANWKGIARCLAGGVSVTDLDAARKRYLARNERHEGTAHLHFTTGHAWETQREFSRAQQEFEKALNLDPLNLTYHQRYQAVRKALAAQPGGKK